MSDPLIDRFAAVIVETFGDDDVVVTRETVAEDVSGWDSLSHTILILALEDEFGIKLPGEAKGFANVGELVDAIEAQRAA